MYQVRLLIPFIVYQALSDFLAQKLLAAFETIIHQCHFIIQHPTQHTSTHLFRFLAATQVSIINDIQTIQHLKKRNSPCCHNATQLSTPN